MCVAAHKSVHGCFHRRPWDSREFKCRPRRADAIDEANCIANPSVSERWKGLRVLSATNLLVGVNFFEMAMKSPGDLKAEVVNA
jgi:hypothetical protein